MVDLSDTEKGIQLWDVSFHLFGRQLDREIGMADDDEDFHLFADPEEGHTLKLGVEEKSIGKTSLYAVESVGFKKRKNELDDELLDAAPCLDDLLIEVEYDQLKAIFFETDDDSSSKDGKSGSKKDKKKKDKKKKKKDNALDDDDEIPF